MKKYAIEIKWGIIFILVQLAWMVGEKMAGLHDEHIDKHAIYTNFIAIPAILLYVLALLEKRKKYFGGKMNYMQGFLTGIGVTIVVTILAPLSQYITSTVITPDYFNNAINYAVANGKLSQEEAEKYFSLKSYMVQTVLFTPVMGIVTSAIVALFTRKK